MTDYRWPREYALEAAEALREELQHACSRIEIAGSLRRKLRTVGDIELLVVPNEGIIDELNAAIMELMQQGRLDYRLSSDGTKTYGKQNKLLVDRWHKDLPVDIFSADDRNWGMFLLVRTGSKDFNVKVMGELKRRFGPKGGGHAYPKYLGEGRWQGGITTNEGEEILCPDEQTIFDKLKWEYKEPENRI